MTYVREDGSNISRARDYCVQMSNIWKYLDIIIPELAAKR